MHQIFVEYFYIATIFGLNLGNQKNNETAWDDGMMGLTKRFWGPEIAGFYSPTCLHMFQLPGFGVWRAAYRDPRIETSGSKQKLGSKSLVVPPKTAPKQPSVPALLFVLGDNMWLRQARQRCSSPPAAVNDSFRSKCLICIKYIS